VTRATVPSGSKSVRRSFSSHDKGIPEQYSCTTWPCFAYVSICQHMSAYVSIRQHTPAYASQSNTAALLGLASPPPLGLFHLHFGWVAGAVPRRQHTPACASIRQHTSAYTSMRQHTSAYVSIHQHAPACASIRQHTSANYMFILAGSLAPLPDVQVSCFRACRSCR
jgi:hypothetical protein